MATNMQVDASGLLEFSNALTWRSNFEYALQIVTACFSATSASTRFFLESERRTQEGAGVRLVQEAPFAMSLKGIYCALRVLVSLMRPFTLSFLRSILTMAPRGLTASLASLLL